MRRKHMPGCYCCCDCVDAECGCYQFLEEYISPNIPKTELVITGNHPATLVAYIEYEKASYDAFDDKWRCDGWLFDADHKCCIGGVANVDTDESTEVWQDNFCCQQKRSGSFSYEAFSCCNFPGEVEWKKFETGSISLKTASALGVSYGVWYRKLAVRMYAGQQNGCCGVWVEACLSFRRFLSSQTCQSYKSSWTYTTLCQEDPCGDVVIDDCEEVPVERTCSFSCENHDIDSDANVPCPTPIDISSFAIPEDDPTEDPGLHYSILRKKFLPGNPACTQRNIPVLNITFTPEDNILIDSIGLDVGICDMCPTAQGLDGPNQDFCVPDLVYYDRGTYDVPNVDCCPFQPTTSTCGGVEKAAAFLHIGGACYTDCDNVSKPTGGWDFVCGVGYHPQFGNCYGIFPDIVGSALYESSDVTHSVTDVCTIDSCGHLLFGEIEDTWTLSITLPP